jgi:hypothetical protein
MFEVDSSQGMGERASVGGSGATLIAIELNMAETRALLMTRLRCPSQGRRFVDPSLS